ncbi:MAG: DUF4231 domain-containing protein [Symploca sp. SIO2E6]|nr:DUF4231 domain-containing protein [Symploca sp. SIO2E6]
MVFFTLILAYSLLSIPKNKMRNAITNFRLDRSKKQKSKPDKLWLTIQSLELTPEQRRFFENRFWDQYNWFSKKATQNQKRGNKLGIGILIANTFVTSFAAFNIGITGAIKFINISTFTLSICSTITTQVHKRYNFDQMGDEYRVASETLKSMFWQLAANKNYIPEADYLDFVTKVEGVIQGDLQKFIVAQTKQNEEQLQAQERRQQASGKGFLRG